MLTYIIFLYLKSKNPSLLVFFRLNKLKFENFLNILYVCHEMNYNGLYFYPTPRNPYHTAVKFTIANKTRIQQLLLYNVPCK